MAGCLDWERRRSFFVNSIFFFFLDRGHFQFFDHVQKTCFERDGRWVVDFVHQHTDCLTQLVDALLAYSLLALQYSYLFLAYTDLPFHELPVYFSCHFNALVLPLLALNFPLVFLPILELLDGVQYGHDVKSEPG